MLAAVGVKRALPDMDSIGEAFDVYHALRNYEKLRSMACALSF